MPANGTLVQDVPVYALYGEADALRVPRGVHAETISSRSLALDWRIAPHRHSALYQALLVIGGEALASAEERRIALAPGSLVWVPPLCVHAYDFTPGTVGIVVSIPEQILRASLVHAPAVLDRLARFVAIPTPLDAGEKAEIHTLADSLLRDYQTMAAGREASLAARAALLAIWTARQAGRSAAGETPAREQPAVASVRRFLARVEATYGEDRPLSDYAREIGVSLSHLNRVCRRVTGRSPLRLLQDRRLLEAKRLLSYTAMPVGQVAFRIGFEDPAYFSRFFRQRTGESPLRFRRLADEGATIDNP